MWPGLGKPNRSKPAERLRPLFAEILNRKDEIADLICAENGKPRVEAVGHEITTCLANLDFLLRRAPDVLAPASKVSAVASSSGHGHPKGLWGGVGDFALRHIGHSVGCYFVRSSGWQRGDLGFESPPAGGLVIDLMRACHLPPDSFRSHQMAVGAALIEARPDKICFTGSQGHGSPRHGCGIQHPSGQSGVGRSGCHDCM